ncbi:MAG TPA: YajQ family cyclic di-GMP-binding protein [Bacteriovoracaceae bacterium]|nr:YajQ family cyclic di-GMP-binding protein [Bacteriovoracaceae bacterium]
MASFDLVSKVNEMELANAISNAMKVVNGRFDFKGSDASIDYKEKEKLIEMRAEDETKVRALLDILRTNMGKRGISFKGMKESKIEPTGNKMYKMTLTLSAGFDKDAQKTVNRLIKESGFKGKSQYMDEKFRLESKSIDDLQSVFLFLKNHDDLDLQISMENMKR